MMCQHCEQRAVRDGLPGAGHRAQQRGAEPAGLQPLRRHAVLRQQLPVQGPALQLVRRTARPDKLREPGAEPGRHRPDARRDGEVHLLRAAHPGGHASRRGGRTGPSPTATSRRRASSPARRGPSCSAISTIPRAAWPRWQRTGGTTACSRRLGVKPRVGYLAGRAQPRCVGRRRAPWLRRRATRSASRSSPAGRMLGCHRRCLPAASRGGRRPSGGPASCCRRRCSRVGAVAVELPGGHRHRHLGPEPHRRLGVRHHELRVLDRHRPRGHAHLGHPVPAPAALAHVGQPRGRGHDAVRRDVRGPLSADPHGPAVARLLVRPVPEHARARSG